MFWQLIRENKRKSFFLFLGLSFFYAALGYMIGYTQDSVSGGLFGLTVALGLFSVQAGISFFAGDSILLASAQAIEVSHSLHPQLFNVVEEMKISAALPVLPKVYIIADPALNAFATGVRLENSSLAITAGLLNVLTRDELQGVIAHEMSHIKNRDVLYMTLAGVMLGAIQMLTDSFLRRGFRKMDPLRSRSYGSNSESGNTKLAFLALAIILSIVGPLIAQFFYFSLSRRREFLADAYAVRLTRFPEGLASALEKISFKSKLQEVSPVTAALFIENPKKESLFNLYATHPPIEERIRILRKMSGADYLNYQKAFSEIRGKVKSIIPRQSLIGNETLPLRTAPLTAAGPVEPAQTPALNREVLDLMRATNEFSFIQCECGMSLKVPPELKDRALKCPRCARRVQIPLALEAVADQALSGRPLKDLNVPKLETLKYTRQNPKAWETFKCSCGKSIQISPIFQGSRMDCPACGRKIEISVPAAA